MKVDYVHKDTTTGENIRKEFSDVIYPTMVIRSQAETIELQEKEIERLNNIIINIAGELDILLQSEDFELIIMQLRNIVFRLKGADKE